MRYSPGSMSDIELVIPGRARDLGGFGVRRLLPAVQRRLIGPFIFFDEMGPAQMAPGTGMDVRPHPHISLATVTFLFEGEIDHRDSLGTFQTIRPGDVNWMIAGSGIAHSERTGPEARKTGFRIHGIQCWVALPMAHEEMAPKFEHHPHATLPRVEGEGYVLDVIAGESFGKKSPVSVLSPTLYAHAMMEDGARIVIDGAHEQRAIHVVTGAIVCGDDEVPEGAMAVFVPGKEVSIRAKGKTRVMILGGAKLDGERHIFWNFVSSSEARIEKAKDDWQNGRFALVPGDEKEHIPLPSG